MPALAQDLFAPGMKKVGWEWGWGPGGATYTQTKPPSVASPVSSGVNREAAAQAEKQRQAGSLAKGAAYTVLTGGTGIKDDPLITNKKLFGE